MLAGDFKRLAAFLHADTDGDGNNDATDANPLTSTAADDTANASSGNATTVNVLANDEMLTKERQIRGISIIGTPNCEVKERKGAGV